ncbi:MAG: putative lipoprotein [Bacteroidetes bacterium]|nr:putative lipoprotein [Bacteroidota bacterium]
MKRDWKRKIIGGLCLSSIAFVFQACYGTPQDFGNDLLIEGQVKSKTSGLPIQGIKVSVADKVQYTNTDENGKFSFYIERFQNAKINFTDIDSDHNGSFSNKDTLVTINDSVLMSKQPKVYLNIELENK